jgi:hypothetical protein
MGAFRFFVTAMLGLGHGGYLLISRGGSAVAYRTALWAYLLRVSLCLKVRLMLAAARDNSPQGKDLLTGRSAVGGHL